MLFHLLFACAEPPPAPLATPEPMAVPSASPAVAYADDRARLAHDRRRLAAAPRPEGRAAARRRLLTALDEELLPAWFGTPWDFYGTSTVPGEGHIACGYFVSTVLEHAGLRVERVTMAQQPSEWIVKTFATEAQLKRFRRKTAAEVVDWVRTHDDGLFVVGLDHHVGFLVLRGGDVRFCHSAFTAPAAVTCGDPLTDPGFVSEYRVVGPVLTDDVVDAWLDGEALPTFQP